MKLINLVPDYQCFPLWDMPPGAYGDLVPKALPISQLQGQLMVWARAYDATLSLEDPVNSGFLTANARIAFEAEGMRLADRLREELGSQVEVQVKVRASVKAKELWP